MSRGNHAVERGSPLIGIRPCQCLVERSERPRLGVAREASRSCKPCPVVLPKGIGGGSPPQRLRQLFGMIRKVFFARLGWEYAVAALNASESKMML